MKKQRVFVTGATGGMGFASLKEMLKDNDKQDIVFFKIPLVFRVLVLPALVGVKDRRCALWQFLAKSVQHFPYLCKVGVKGY